MSNTPRCFTYLSPIAHFASLGVAILAVAVLVGLAPAAEGAEGGEAPAVKRAPTAPPKRKEEPEVPPPVELKGADLVTKDGWQLRATFFPSNLGKDAVPVILLHGQNGSRADYRYLATYLQQQGHAVLVPDLRGHGESRKYQSGNEVREIDDPKKLGAEQFSRMVEFDMETFKSFLRRKNNDGELNLEKLCVVGADMGGLVALNWAAFDWSWPQYPGKKQGQYVKAVVLISPIWSFKGLDAAKPLSNQWVRSAISIYIFYGNGDSKQTRDAQRIHTTLERFREKPKDDQPEAEILRMQTLFLKGMDTNLAGTKMLGVRGVGVDRRIAQFIDLRLIQQDIPWREIGQKQ